MTASVKSAHRRQTCSCDMQHARRPCSRPRFVNTVQCSAHSTLRCCLDSRAAANMRWWWGPGAVRWCGSGSCSDASLTSSAPSKMPCRPHLRACREHGKPSYSVAMLSVHSSQATAPSSLAHNGRSSLMAHTRSSPTCGMESCATTSRAGTPRSTGVTADKGM